MIKADSKVFLKAENLEGDVNRFYALALHLHALALHLYALTLHLYARTVLL